MNSSVKSFVPRVTAGLPFPGCELAAGVLDAAELGVELVLELLLPHAATNRAASSAISRAAPNRSRCDLCSRAATGLILMSPLGGGIARSDRFGGGPEPLPADGRRPKRNRRHEALYERQQAVDEKGEHGDRQRPCDDARHTVARL